MKRKKITLIITIIVSINLVLSGCQESIKKVSVGDMSLDIPSGWQKRQLQETIDIDTDMASYWYMDVYSPDTVDDEIYSLYVICEDIKGYHESFGSPHQYEPNSDVYWGYLKDEYLISSLAILFPYLNIAQQYGIENSFKLTVDDYDATEIQYKFVIEGDSYIANVVTIFSANNLGILILVRCEAPEHYTDQYDWGVIRDSVVFK